MLKPLGAEHDLIWITEKTAYTSNANYTLTQTGLNDIFFPLKMIANAFRSLFIWVKEKPDCLITTGTMVVVPMALLAKLCGKKLIYIESFAKIKDANRAGRFLYRYADLFIVQWESMLEVYPKAVFGGSIY